MTLSKLKLLSIESFAVQSLSCVWFFVIPWTAACQVSLSITISQSLHKLMSIESVMPTNHLILCRPLLLLPSVFPSITVFSTESVLPIRWTKYWSFSFSLSPSNEYSGLVSFRIDWFDLFAVPGALLPLLIHFCVCLSFSPVRGEAFLKAPCAVSFCLFLRSHASWCLIAQQILFVQPQGSLQTLITAPLLGIQPDLGPRRPLEGRCCQTEPAQTQAWSDCCPVLWNSSVLFALEIFLEPVNPAHTENSFLLSPAGTQESEWCAFVGPGFGVMKARVFL